MAERGFANVTIEDITEVADVAPRTFFNYFPSKESAVIGADPERVALMQVKPDRSTFQRVASRSVASGAGGVHRRYRR